MPDSSLTFAVEIAKFFAQAVVVVIGWWVVNDLTRSREKDKSRREMALQECDAISALVDSFFLKSYAYHTTERKIQSELLMKMEITHISYRLSNLEALKIPIAEISGLLTALIRLKRAATGNHFEDEHTIALGEESPELADLADAAVSLNRQLIEVKSTQFN